MYSADVETYLGIICKLASINEFREHTVSIL